jgi:hypothetical protein
MTKVFARWPASASVVLEPSESLTDPIVDPPPIDVRDLADRPLAELSIEQLARLASRWADEIIPLPENAPPIVTTDASSTAHINPVLASLWSRGEIRDEYIDLWRTHASTCDVCTSIIEDAESRR